MQTIKKASCCPSGEHDHAIVKKLTVFGLFKRCGIWLKRNPFKRVFKCSECKMIYHRQCGKNKMTKAASDHDENAVDKRTAEVEGVHVESVEGRQDAVVPAENANLKKTGVTTMARLPMKTIMTKVRRREQTAKGVVALRLYDGENVKIDLRDVYRSQWIYRSSTANVRPLVRVSGVTEITALEYFKLLSNTEKAKTPRKSAIVRRDPQPTRSKLTSADYLEMAAAWDPIAFKKRRKNEGQRRIYSVTIYNSTMMHSEVQSP